MSLDVMYLVELLRSSFWAWTPEGCRELMRRLHLGVVGEVGAVTTYRSSRGFVCVLFGDTNGQPDRLEFRFPVDPRILEHPEAKPMYFQMSCMLLRQVLGREADWRGAGEQEWQARWNEREAILGVELDGEVSLLTLARPGTTND